MAVRRETRSVQGFDSISLQGFGDIHLKQGDQEGLVIEADEDILPRIKSEVVGGKLDLGPKTWLDVAFLGVRKIDFYIDAIQVHRVSISGAGSLASEQIATDQLKLSVSGSGSMEIGRLDAQDVELGISGSGKMQLGGTVQKMDVHISGAGNIHSKGLDSQEASVHISGTGEVDLKAGQRLDVRISGAGTVQYLGTPALRQSITGIGKVSKIEVG